MTRVLVVAGPTGVGKTRVAAHLARLVPIEIVSADSRQLYRYLNIGTAKPPPEERAAVPYHGLDLVTPTERYSAGRFAARARQWIAEIGARGRLPVVVGGTGFYLRALFEGLFAEPALDPVRRARLRAVLRGLGARVEEREAGGRRSRMTREARAELERWAARLDPGFAGGGAQRAARVVEVALLAGRRLSALHRATPPAPSGLAPWYAVLTLPRDRLADRIRARAEAMVAAGLVDEVRRLVAAGLSKDAPGLDAVGYREVLRVLDGVLPMEDLAAAIATATRQYAKRQMTWLRHQLRAPALWLDASGAPGALAEQVLAGYRAAD